MPNPKRPRLVRKKRVHHYGGRGPIYAWLRTNYEEIGRLRAIHLNLWAELAQDMIADGITDAPAGRGLRDRIWKAWQRVCRDVEREAAAAKPVRKYPSRIAPDWRPAIVPPPPTRYVAPPAAPTPVDDDMTPEGQAELDKIKRILAEHDRRKFGF
jgi:hypothetical protein